MVVLTLVLPGVWARWSNVAVAVVVAVGALVVWPKDGDDPLLHRVPARGPGRDRRAGVEARTGRATQQFARSCLVPSPFIDRTRRAASPMIALYVG